MIRFILNENEVATDLPPGTLLLDYIRYHRHLKGTKIGCREGDCGACTVLVGEIINDKLVYSSATSCLMAIINAAGKHIVTIEGTNMENLNLIQQAMSDEAATQCGFCTPGFAVSLAGFCLNDIEHNYNNAIAAIDGNICRCTGYKSIERAAIRVAESMSFRKETAAIDFVCEKNLLPAYFKGIKNKLQAVATNGLASSESKTKRFLAGGTDLYVQQPEEMTHAEIEDLFSKKALKGIYEKDGNCFVGGATTVNDISQSGIFNQYFLNLKKLIRLVSSTSIRNMATAGGNLVNASPIGDLTIFFLALNAQLTLSDGQNERIKPLREFYKGYKQLDKTQDEFIKTIFFKLPQQNQLFNFEKVSKRTCLDIASVNSAAIIEVKDGNIILASLSAGGVGPVPMYLKKASEFLEGKNLSEEVIFQAISIAKNEVSPISDVRGSETYKRLLLSQLIKTHFIELFPSLSIDKMLSQA